MLRSAMSVLRLFSTDRRELAMAEAARLLHRPATTVSRWLRDMAAAGFLERDVDTGRYRLGRALIEIAATVDVASRLQRVCRAAAERLAAVSGETTYVGVRQGDGAILVDGVASARSIRLALTIGERVALHASATGKCLLAWTIEEEARSLLPGPLPASTPYTITSWRALARELAVTRDRGYAVSRRELEDDLVAVAAPVRGQEGNVVAALSVGGPSSRITDGMIPFLGRLTLQIADAASRSIGAARTGPRATTSPSTRRSAAAPRATAPRRHGA